MPKSFDAVVFAGGGNRCFWQLGFWEILTDAQPQSPKVATGVSAGSAAATLVFAGRAAQSLAYFKDRVRQNPRNVHLTNLRNQRPVFPHQEIFRSTLLDALDAEAMRTLRAPDKTEVRVQIGRFPGWLERRPWAGALVAWAVYQTERMGPNPIHARAGQRVGFRHEVVSVRDCERPEDVAEAVLHSSCTPPFTPLYFRDQRPVIDGSIVDATSLPALLEPGPNIKPIQEDIPTTLILLTRPYGKLPHVPGRLYVQPSEAVRIAKFDYTNPAGVQRAYDLGRRDAEHALQQRILD
jgi:predicted acylesterase/phospholipase RssA